LLEGNVKNRMEDTVSDMVSAIHPHLRAINARPIPHASLGIAPTEVWGVQLTDEAIDELFLDNNAKTFVRMMEQIVLNDLTFRLDDPLWYKVISDDGVRPSEDLLSRINKLIGQVAWLLGDKNAD
jgi:hypothetical protein